MTTNNQVNVNLSGADGTGNFAGSTNATFITPNLGTPSAGVLTNCTGYPGASCVYINSQTASSSAELDFTNAEIANYNILLLLFTNGYPANNATQIYVQISNNGGSTYQTTGYKSCVIFWPTGSATTDNSNGTNGFRLCPAMSNVTTNTGINGYMYIYNIGDGDWPSYTSALDFYSTTHSAVANGMGAGNSGSAINVNALRIIASAGNLASGTYTLYGIRETT